jgi:hypothetical protein
LHGAERLQISPKTQSAKAPAWSLTITTERGGRKKYELRDSSGTRVLPADRSKWPADVRSAQEKMDEYDKKRTIRGHLISAHVGTARLED